MRILLLSLGTYFFTLSLAAQELYSRAYGDPSDPPIVFLHGGPGYDAFAFEVTTAPVLADRGFYVITYDRRGEGRSQDSTAAYTFAQAYADLDSIYAHYGLKSATLLGHSFGGVIATLYAEQYPRRAKAVILLGVPVDTQASLRNILLRSREHYIQTNDSISLRYVDMIERMDTASISYSGLTFLQAIRNGLYRPHSPTADAEKLYTQVTKARLKQGVSSRLSMEANQGYFDNEHYTTLRLAPHLSAVIDGGTAVYGIYGMEDGLYSLEDIKYIESMLEAGHFQRIGSASHNIFIDQQPTFLTLIETWLK